MKQFFLVAILSLSFFSESFSQQNFHSGYIITLNGDTIEGLIDFKNRSRNAIVCLFKEDFQNELISYYPGEIQSYRYYDDRYYVSKKVSLADKTEWFFLEYLFDGIMSLFYLSKDGRDLYFIEKDDGVLHLLQNDEIEEYYKGWGSVTYENKRFRGQLAYIVSDHPDLTKQVQTAKLNHESLISIARNYHEYVCPDEDCFSYESRIPFIRTRLALYSGISISGIRIIGHHAYSLVEMNNSINPSMGGMLEIFFPRMNQTVSVPISFEFSRSFYHGSIEGSNLFYTLTAEYHDVIYKSANLKRTIQLQYSYPTGLVRPTISAGFISMKNYSGEFRRITDLETENTFYPIDDSFLYLKYLAAGGRFSLGTKFHLKGGMIPFVNFTYDYIGSKLLEENRVQSKAKTRFHFLGFKVGLFL